MSDPPDLDALARRYVSLWQEQITAMAADPELSHNLGRLMSTAAALGPMSLAGLWSGLTRGAGMPGTASPEPQPGGAEIHDHEPGSEHGQSPPADASDSAGTAPAGTPPDDRRDDMGELHRRLAELEARIAALEAGARPSRRRVAKKPRADKP